MSRSQSGGPRFAAALPDCVLNRSAPGGEQEEKERDIEEAAPECGPLLAGMSCLAPRLVIQAAFAAALPGCVLNRSAPEWQEEEEADSGEAAPECGPLGGMSCLAPSLSCPRFAAALPGYVLNRSAPGGEQEEDREEAAPECGPLSGICFPAPSLVV